MGNPKSEIRNPKEARRSKSGGATEVTDFSAGMSFVESAGRLWKARSQSRQRHWPLWFKRTKSGRGLPQSKTLARVSIHEPQQRVSSSPEGLL